MTSALLRAQFLDEFREFRRGIAEDEPGAGGGRRRRGKRGRFPDRAVEPVVDFVEGIGQPVRADLRPHPEFFALEGIGGQRDAVQLFVRVEGFPVDRSRR